jgi:putative transposon-encoded protein
MKENLLRGTLMADIRFKEVVERTATKSGTGAVVYVPKSWRGRKIKAFLIDEEGGEPCGD